MVVAGDGMFSYHGAGHFLKEKEPVRLRLWIFLPLLTAGFSGVALADSIDINLSSDSIQATYGTNWRTADFDVGLLSNRDTHDWAASAGLLARGARETQSMRTEAGVGGKVYVVSVGDNTLEALGLGGAFRVFPHNGSIGLGAYGFLAPNIVTAGDGKRFWEAGAHVDFEIVRNTADIYVGYRKLRAELDDGSKVTVDSGGHVGVRINF